jgi:hypothetical protein
VPAVLLAVTAGFIVANLSGAEVQGPPAPTPTRTPAPTYTPMPTPTQVKTTLELSGTLVWQGSGDDVFELEAVEFPSGAWTQELSVLRREPPTGTDVSADGVWRWRYEVCALQPFPCDISFVASDGRVTALALEGVVNGQWAPTGSTLAVTVERWTDDVQLGDAIIVVPDVAAPQPVVIYSAPIGTRIPQFTWHGDELIIAEDDGTATRFAVLALDGTRRKVEDVVLPTGAAAGSPLHTAPAARSAAFTTFIGDDLRLTTFNIASGAVTDHGDISTVSTSECRPRIPSGVPSFFTEGESWPAPAGTAGSPDGSRLAFTSGSQPPYTLSILDLRTDAVMRGTFAAGYPREVAWSPDGTMIAVATYDDAAERYETWIVDAATAEQRYLLDGCRVVWSPDSHFVAVRGKDQPGIAIIEIATGRRVQLTDDSANVPIRWLPAN